MGFPFVFAVLVLLPSSILGKWINFVPDPTLDDLLETNVTCAFSESCKVNDSFIDRRCSCDEECSSFGTCCIDSQHWGTSTQLQECRNPGMTFTKFGYFMVSRCPAHVDSKSVWKDLCEKEWNGEDDLMMLAPVSSLHTSATYKNYYCFRCHEDSDQFLNWDINIEGNPVDKNRVSEDFTITYDTEKQRWIVTTGDDYVMEDTTFTFYVPEGVTEYPQSCRYVLVSDCRDDWTDKYTREKCRSAYTAVVYLRNNSSVSYKNPHCALCNFESVENISCGKEVIAASVPKRGFSFSYLLNIHREDNEKGETKKCEENQLWDPYGKKCRRIACALPGYVVREGRCTTT